MGFGIKELLIVLVIVILLFGTKKFKTIGSDLGSALKGFKKSIADDEASDNEPAPLDPAKTNSDTINNKDKEKSE